jgi:hypothetical protein
MRMTSLIFALIFETVFFRFLFRGGHRVRERGRIRRQADNIRAIRLQLLGEPGEVETVGRSIEHVDFQLGASPAADTHKHPARPRPAAGNLPTAKRV